MLYIVMLFWSPMKFLRGFVLFQEGSASANGKAITWHNLFGNKVFKERQEQSLSRAKCWFLLEFAELTKSLTLGQVFKLTNPKLTTNPELYQPELPNVLKGSTLVIRRDCLMGVTQENKVIARTVLGTFGGKCDRQVEWNNFCSLFWNTLFPKYGRTMLHTITIFI